MFGWETQFFQKVDKVWLGWASELVGWVDGSIWCLEGLQVASDGFAFFEDQAVFVVFDQFLGGSESAEAGADDDAIVDFIDHSLF